MAFGRTDLPFLVVHGAVFWKLVLGGAVVAVTAVIWLIWRRRSRPRIVGLAVVAALSFGIGLKIEYALGSSWGDACFGADLHTLTHDRVVDEPADVSACVHAAAMPGSRDDALTHLLAALDHEPYRDETITRQVYALSAFVEGCDGLPQRLLHDGRFDEAAAAAHDCSDRRTEHLALRAAGKLDEAIRVEVPEERDGDRVLTALPNASEWILTEHWHEAATAADHRAAAIRTDHVRDDRESVDLTATYYQCVAELFRSYAGDAAAAARLRTLAAGAHGGTCQVVLAASTTGDEHRDLVTRDPTDELREAASLRSVLAMSEGIDVDPIKGGAISTFAPEQLLDDPARTMGVSQVAQLWLTATATPTANASLLRLRWLTASQVIAGDVGAAAKSAESAAAAASQLGLDDVLAQYRARHVLLLPALVALHTSSTAAKLPPGTDDDDSFGPVWLRANDARARKTRIDPIVLAAAQGDGSGLPAIIAAGGYRLSTDAQMMAVLPRLTTTRETVIRQLVWSGPPAGNLIRFVGEAFPFDDAMAAASRRDLFRVAGVQADATRWSEVFQRFDKLLRDRRRLVAVMLWRLDRF